jgi:hypothetical protein
MAEHDICEEAGTIRHLEGGDPRTIGGKAGFHASGILQGELRVRVCQRETGNEKQTGSGLETEAPILETEAPIFETGAPILETGGRVRKLDHRLTLSCWNNELFLLAFGDIVGGSVEWTFERLDQGQDNPWTLLSLE